MSSVMKDISSDGQVEDVRLRVDDDVLEDALLLSGVDRANSKQLNLELHVQTWSHLWRVGVKTRTQHVTGDSRTAGNLQVLVCRGL